MVYRPFLSFGFPLAHFVPCCKYIFKNAVCQSEASTVGDEGTQYFGWKYTHWEIPLNI